ncbi:hypothetical protein KEM48_006382 [Puccinia striiformis f. sp. tritici PST-130]|nr:hypothetical protein KEM48_006382 [Puccinia striiformis f. sp. tritici PST-130]
MPPKSTTTSAKAASIPNRVKNTDKHLNGTPAGGSGGRPTKDAYSQEQDQYKREIDRLQSEISEVRLKIGDPKTGGNHGPLVTRRKALREEMDALREEQSKGKSSRGKLLDQIKVANDSVQRKIKELNGNRAKLPYKSSVEVDARIRQLESQIESGTMRIVEEKKALMEIQNLRKAKKLVDAFGPQQEIIEAEKEKVDELRKQLDDPNGKSTNDRWSEIKRELDQINEKLDESSKSRDKLFEERNKLQDSLTEVFNKKRESATRHKEANEKYYAKMQEDQQRRIDRQKAERDAQARAEIEEVHIEMREQAALPAYGREIEDCRTLDHTTKIKEVRQVDGQDGFEGMVAIKKKGAEEEEFFMGGGGGTKKNKKNKKTVTEAPSNNQSLNLPLSTINALYALAVPVPMTREDVAKTIATLSEKKNWFTENQARVTKERIAETEAKIAAAQAKFKPNPATPVEPSAESEPAPVEKEAETVEPAQE